MRINTYHLIALLLLWNSSCGQKEEHVVVNATFHFINDYEHTITITDSGCGFDEVDRFQSVTILPSDTLIVHQQNRVYMIPKPNIDNYELFIGDCLVVYGDSLKCDLSFNTGIGRLANYEERKELSKNNFEFTYRFTNETMSQTQDCN